jgi:hypothetical protein
VKLTGADTAGTGTYGVGLSPESRAVGTTDQGRWPTNVVLSHAALLDPETGEPVGDACADGCVDGCVVAELDRQGGTSRTHGVSWAGANRDVYGARTAGQRERQSHHDVGGASRFYPVFRWEAKAPSSERPRMDGIAHPTVKPLALMRWLVRLVTPPGGVVLDWCAGSGTTGQAARAEGCLAVLVEREAQYLPLILSRLEQGVLDLAGETA